MSSIPHHNPSNVPLSRGRKYFLIGLVVAPLIGYAVLKRRQLNIEQEKRTVEEEGRRSWVLMQKQKENTGQKKDEGDLRVSVGRSGGGV